MGRKHKKRTILKARGANGVMYYRIVGIYSDANVTTFFNDVGTAAGGNNGRVSVVVKPPLGGVQI